MIWITGAHGMLGSELTKLCDRYHIPYIGTGHEVDILNYESLQIFARQQAQTARITYIVNCAAYTAVDKAESEADKARSINEVGPANLAKLAKDIDAILIHISTDYVFDGVGIIGNDGAVRPYVEDDPVNPQCVYGKTKAAGEKAILHATDKAYIFRTSWLYGFDGKNFVMTMVSLMNKKDALKVVSDQRGAPTFCGDLAMIIIQTLQNTADAPFGIYHVCNTGSTTWYEFALAIQKEGVASGRIVHDCTVQPCTTAEYPVKAKRPAYSVLDTAKILALPAMHNLLPSWQESLHHFMNDKRFYLPIS
ncbi:MAG: dTDP-4-dehydrorhamnose reductase [Treponema sp.]|nr:dTDP-4-dehydrorhamnose reductase [Treponema sp.]